MTPRVSKAEAERRIKAINDCLMEGHRPIGVPGNGPAAISVAADRLGMKRVTLQNGLAQLKLDHGLEPDWSLWRRPEPTPAKSADKLDLIRGALRKPTTLEGLSAASGLGYGALLDALEELKQQGVNVMRSGELFSVERTFEPAYASNAATFEYVSRPDNTFVFGACGDTHLGSKYERLDVLNDLYDRFAKAGADRVFHTGNWIDGEARFNRHEINVHGMHGQCVYMAEKYPQREGLVTYAVTGDDHEGWYAQREGVDVGRYAENVMRDKGRTDWVNLGYMEANVRLVNANTGKTSMLAVVHPGGGSAYADSYTIQKIIEVLEGGEKPAVGLYGHYHKLLAGEYRNVWWLQTGCTKDPDPFARKKKLRWSVGGALVTLEQDPESGAIIGFTPQMFRYFNRAFMNGRWSHHGPVSPPERDVHG